MLRTRTNDVIEILKLDDYVEDFNFGVDETYNLKGVQGIDILKYNIILLGDIYYYKTYENDTGYVGFTYDEMTNGAYVLEVFDNSIYLTYANFLREDVIKSIPTDVRLIEDQGKLQLQLEHDSEVLSIDEDVNDLLGSKFGYKNTIIDDSISVRIQLEIGDDNDEATIEFDNVYVKREYDGWGNIEDFQDALTSEVFIGRYVVYTENKTIKYCGVCSVVNNVFKFDNEELNNSYTGGIQGLTSLYLRTGEVYAEI